MEARRAGTREPSGRLVTPMIVQAGREEGPNEPLVLGVEDPG